MSEVIADHQVWAGSPKRGLQEPGGDGVFWREASTRLESPGIQQRRPAVTAIMLGRRRRAFREFWAA